jgi:cytosine/adenosine deaminase-related metal-dependent hydrolase
MPRYDLVIRGGRVIDRSTGLDGIADVGIVGSAVAEVGSALDSTGAGETIDASDKWVIPGVIDAHAHFAGPLNKAFDPAIGLTQLAAAGVTTAIDLGGEMPVLTDGIKRRGSGISTGSVFRVAPGQTIESETPSVGDMREVMQAALAAGFLGVKMWGGYYPLTPDGTANVIRACNELGAHVAFHVGTTETGSQLDGLREIPRILGDDGRLHIAHINAYCRGSILPAPEEVDEALTILSDLRGRIVSEVHMAVPNFTQGEAGDDGVILADVARNCLRLRNYEATADGMRQAIFDGYGSVVVQRNDVLTLLTGAEAVVEYDGVATRAGMSFPVNLEATAAALTIARYGDGEFIVDAVASDGGMLPRNVNVEQTMKLVHDGQLTVIDLVTKLSYNPARMLGLTTKGALKPGTDADVTIIDPRTGAATDSIAIGRRVLDDGKVVGVGGTLLVGESGESAASESGLDYRVIETSKGMMYS